MANRPSIRSAVGRADTLPGMGTANPPGATPAAIEKLMGREVEWENHWAKDIKPPCEQDSPTEQVTRPGRKALYAVGVGVGLGLIVCSIAIVGLVYQVVMLNGKDKPAVASAAADHSKHTQMRGDVVQMPDGTYKVSTLCEHGVVRRLPPPVLPTTTK